MLTIWEVNSESFGVPHVNVNGYRACETQHSYRSVNQFQNLALHELEILGISGRSAADDVVDPTVIILSA